MELSFEMKATDQAARDLLCGTAEWWTHLRAAVAEGFCARCRARLEPVEHVARVAGYCEACDRTWFVGGPDEKWAESGEQIGRCSTV